jgi:hypothetical protein
MNSLKFINSVIASVFLTLCILGFTACEKSSIEDQMNNITNLQTRSTRVDTVLIFADTLNGKLKIDFGFKTIFFESVSNGYFKVYGEPGIDMIKQNFTPYENLIVIDSLNNVDTLYFDNNDIIDASRPCCSRDQFKAWYRFFRDEVWSSSPELEVMCDILPVCGPLSYVSAGIACCYYGEGPPYIYDNNKAELFTIVEFLTL